MNINTNLFIILCSFSYSDPWQDLKDNYGKGGYERLTNLKRTYPHLKVIKSKYAKIKKKKKQECQFQMVNR